MITVLSLFASVVLSLVSGVAGAEGRRRAADGDDGGPCGPCPARSGSATVAEGWWTDETLGALRRPSPARRARMPRCTSGRRRGRGTAPTPTSTPTRCRLVDRARRRRARAGRRGRVPTAELARSGRRVLRPRDGRLRARADRAHLRPQRGALHPRPEPRARRTSRPTATATSTISTSSTARAPDELPDLELHVVVGSPRARRRAPRVRRVALGRRRRRRAAPPDDRAADPDDVCVLAYTSGTTSDPKGVMHSHRTLLAELAAHARVDHARIARTSWARPSRTRPACSARCWRRWTRARTSI